MTSAQRRARTALPAAAAALALGGALLGAAPAQASDVTPRPAKPTARSAEGPSEADLLGRVEGSIADLKDGEADTAPERKQEPAQDGGSGVKESYIIGGSQATITEAPWMVQLHYFDDKGTATEDDDEGFFCGGSLVAPNKVLTAAHCVYGLDWATNGAVIAGTGEMATATADGLDLHGGRITGVERQWMSPTYDDASLTGGDVAVLTLFEAMPYKTLQLTQSGDTASYKEGTSATVYGWGRTSSTSQDGSQTLKKAVVPMRSDASCTSYYGGEFVAGQMACAGNPATGQDAGTVSPCNGDSGGPLVVGGRVAGVVSWGVQDCVASGAYSVYAKSSTYVGQVNARIDDTDLDFDGRADLFARTSGGEGWQYYSRGTTLGGRVSLGDFSAYNLVRQADLNRDGYQGYLYRTTGGVLKGIDFNGDDGYTEYTIGSGWGAMKNVLLPGDLSGDGLPDLVAQDTQGYLWLYPGLGNGRFGARVSVGSGWGVMTITGKGDYTGDGKADMLARDTSGRLWLYPGRGTASAPFTARVLAGTSGWNFTAYVGTGDMSGDGRADLLVRDSAGVLWFYPGRGSATAPFGTRVKVGSGWNAFNLFG
ncbi:MULTISPECIES: trypsin-like serine protease [Streptomyces]|uniref:Serine protease n=2 Tax=Streptomyces TaxID=1883 RepID=A0A100Y3H3_9ACTN|nr:MULTISPECIES: trypsin-like serine protease [Streptomyces]KUH36988.1 serine protease [Streptomyces kanasensis]UUS32981.1 trypsin-like serine protease [Streptomyces changanensis]